ncbi:MAG: hypothetical protein RL380_875, partial [Verrucomicrobiota bacterium]
LASTSADDLDFLGLLACIKTAREEFKTQIAKLSPQTDSTVLTTN